MRVRAVGEPHAADQKYERGVSWSENAPRWAVSQARGCASIVGSGKPTDVAGQSWQ